ncbi:hypothetical protein FJQ98_20525 [Lysinibacillus agricola]|uniref:Phage abortive infection protein n=1 Tax=Lysinibacillus agricola TaxID=2590012 RepID=A0ABX7APV5_9BACI|nr:MULTISPECIES: hypothetical protein [Lysinibacillus]KOS60891.1 hypothetical protein AN161_20130 [Lysinibacillus sp. FJAT-14222]QQP11557.1 hypothetical protein FJQ98_20525 [Lysinibacillus agricola]
MNKSEKLLVNVLISLAGLTISVVVVLTIIAYQIGVGELEKPNRIAIISGLLSMVGGIAGAFGAYFVATYQMKKQIEHDKKKEERQKKENILHNLVILKRLNDEAMEFVRFFAEQHSNPSYDSELRTNIRFREKDLFWIVNNVNSINYEILREGYITDYLKFSREINNMYIDIEGLERIPDTYLARRVLGLRRIILERNENLILFDRYLKSHINIIQKQIEELV